MKKVYFSLSILYLTATISTAFAACTCDTNVDEHCAKVALPDLCKMQCQCEKTGACEQKDIMLKEQFESKKIEDEQQIKQLEAENKKIQETNRMKETLMIINEFADRFCNTIPPEAIKGDSENIELLGNAKAELFGLLKKLTEMGVGGVAKYERTIYQGVLQNDLKVLLMDRSACKNKIWNDLQSKN